MVTPKMTVIVVVAVFGKAGVASTVVLIVIDFVVVVV